jgi:uncharacterized protein YacL
MDLGDLNFKDVVGLVADFMAIFGVGGFFTWSFVKKETGSRSLEDIGLETFSAAIKLVICCLVFLFLFPFALYLYYWLEYWLSISVEINDIQFKLDGTQVPSIVGLILSLFLWVPTFILFSSVIIWSFKPFKRFWNVFTGSSK